MKIIPQYYDLSHRVRPNCPTILWMNVYHRLIPHRVTTQTNRRVATCMYLRNPTDTKQRHLQPSTRASQQLRAPTLTWQLRTRLGAPGSDVNKWRHATAVGAYEEPRVQRYRGCCRQPSACIDHLSNDIVVLISRHTYSLVRNNGMSQHSFSRLIL